MAATDTDAALRFIEELELEEAPAELRALAEPTPTITGTDTAAYVDAGSLISFVDGVSATHKSDVLNSTLLAQLAANKQYDRERQTDEWYRFYRNVLENVGWTLQEFGFSKYQAGGSTFTVDQVVLEILAAIATPGQAALATAAIDGLKKLADGSKPMTIWDQSSHDASQGNFQLGAAQEKDNVVAMALGAFHFSTNQTTTRFLWFNYSSSQIKLYKGAQRVVLNEDVYARVRQKVIDKLDDRAKQFIADLQI